MIAPLAHRMRPSSLDEIIGQPHLVGEAGFLRTILENKMLVSLIFYGPPGTGKTTIAQVLAREFNVPYSELNAVTSSKRDLEKVIEKAQLHPHGYILIFDEVHRLNKDKQDILLPFIEDGTLYLFGMTTANPYLSINPAVRSRTHLLEVKPLSKDNVVTGLKRALSAYNGLNNKLSISDDALSLIAKSSGGDMRFALNYLEVLSLSNENKVDVNQVASVLKVPNYLLDKDESDHYDSVSALQKSIRGSDVDAALYYLARLAAAGDLVSIERRLLITAYEDIGLANPQAVQRCATAIESAKKVGFPEAIIPLGFSVIDLALSPKSKAATNSIQAAMDIATSTPLDVPDYLKMTPVNIREEDKYPYDRSDLWEKIQYLPELIKNKEIYLPSNSSQYEKVLNAHYERLKRQGRSSDLASLKRKKGN